MTLPTAPRSRPSSSVLTPDSLDSATRPVLATSRMPANGETCIETSRRKENEPRHVLPACPRPHWFEHQISGWAAACLLQNRQSTHAGFLDARNSLTTSAQPCKRANKRRVHKNRSKPYKRSADRVWGSWIDRHYSNSQTPYITWTKEKSGASAD